MIPAESDDEIAIRKSWYVHTVVVIPNSDGRIDHDGQLEIEGMWKVRYFLLRLRFVYLAFDVH